MSFFQHILLTLCLLGAARFVPGAAYAQAESDPATDVAVQDGRKALNGRTSFPFYDPQQDDVRRIDVQAQPEKKKEGTGKDWTPKQRAAPPPRGPANLSIFGSFFQVLGFLLLAAIIIGIVVLLIKAFMTGEQEPMQGTKFVDTTADIDRVEDLPFQLARPTGDFLSEARRLYEAGKYSEAIIYLFSYQLFALDKRHVIRLAKGKTNRQYLRETRSRETLKQLLQRTMISFEDVFFGHHELSRSRFEESWTRLDEFHQQLEQVELAAP